jgi:hypothetical protein
MDRALYSPEVPEPRIRAVPLSRLKESVGAIVEVLDVAPCEGI